MIIVTFSGVLTGLCFLPMRYTVKWSFENTWFVWCLVSLVFLPPLIAWLFIPHLGSVYEVVGSRLIWLVLGSGLLAGMSGFLYGLGISKIGLAGANALSNGISLAIGSFVPLAIQHPDVMKTRLGIGLMLGLMLALTGVIVAAFASHYRGGLAAENTSVESPGGSKTPVRSSKGVLLGIGVSIGAGLLFPAQNLGIAFADEFMKVARQFGSSEVFMTYAFYVPYFATSFVSNGIYSVIMWRRRGSLREWRLPETPRYLWLIMIMAVAWTVAMLTYGWAMPFMGGYGPVIGWPVSLATCNIAAALVETLYGDWKGKALKVLSLGLILLTVSIGIFGFCNARLLGFLG
jgi:L-rhamnose-H+ transport protein